MADQTWMQFLQGPSALESSPYQPSITSSPFMATPDVNLLYDGLYDGVTIQAGQHVHPHASQPGPSNAEIYAIQLENVSLRALSSPTAPREGPKPPEPTFDDLMREMEMEMLRPTNTPVAPPQRPPILDPPRTARVPPHRVRRNVDESAYRHFFRGTDQQELRRALDEILNSEWLALDRPEPTCGKRSVLSQLLSSRSCSTDYIRCLFDGCKYDRFDRLDRAVAHVRVHLGHRPFVCKGDCVSRKW